MSAFTLFSFPIIAVLIGVILAAILHRFSKSALWLLLPFSGSFLLSITLFELLPELFSQPETKVISLAVLLGILLQIFLEFFSKGAEHGHIHLSESGAVFGLFFICFFGPLHSRLYRRFALITQSKPVFRGLFAQNTGEHGAFSICAQG